MPKVELYVATCRVDDKTRVMAWLASANKRVPPELSRLVCEYAGFFSLRAKTDPDGHGVVMHLRATGVDARQDDVIDGLTHTITVPRFGTVQIDPVQIDANGRHALVTPWATELPQFMATAVFLRPLRFSVDQPRGTRLLESSRTHRHPAGEFYAAFTGDASALSEGPCALKLTFALGFAPGASPFGPGGLVLPGNGNAEARHRWALVATGTEDDPCKLGWL